MRQPTHAQAQQHLFEIVTPIFAMPIGRARRSWGLRCVCIGPIVSFRQPCLTSNQKGIHLARDTLFPQLLAARA